jgi:hypothetical protein
MVLEMRYFDKFRFGISKNLNSILILIHKIQQFAIFLTYEINHHKANLYSFIPLAFLSFA